MNQGNIYENGFPVFSIKEAVLTALLTLTQNTQPTFTNQSRNKFGVNNEIFIY